MQNIVHLPFWVSVTLMLYQNRDTLHAAYTNQDSAISLLGDILPRSYCEH